VISVIIPTRNRADLLHFALATIEEQTLSHAQFEILVIDNGSTDNTATVVENWSQKLVNLTSYFEPEPGLHRGRHRGLKEAVYDILVFADDDIEAEPNWLEAIVESFSDPKVALVGGNNRPLFLETPPAWLMKYWQQPSPIGGRALPYLSILELDCPAGPLDPNYVWGCNFSVRRSVLLEAGGFHPDGMPKELMHFRGDGESHVARHIVGQGYRCVFNPAASVFHKVTPERMTSAYLRSRGFAQGVSDSYSHLRRSAMAERPTSAAFRWLYNKLRSGYRHAQTLRIADPELRFVGREIANGYDEGYSFHQKAYKTDSAVREWVARTDYYD
jgi:glucosyl-dolichyl phosphate glucuronosyltransferase